MNREELNMTDSLILNTETLKDGSIMIYTKADDLRNESIAIHRKEYVDGFYIYTDDGYFLREVYEQVDNAYLEKEVKKLAEAHNCQLNVVTRELTSVQAKDSIYNFSLIDLVQLIIRLEAKIKYDY